MVGVTIIKNNKSYIFETSMDSATMCSCQLYALDSCNDDYIVYWKVWENGVPIILELTKTEFIEVFSFSRNMINISFGIQGELNTQISSFTQQNLLDSTFITNFKNKVISQFNVINTTLTI